MTALRGGEDKVVGTGADHLEMLGKFCRDELGDRHRSVAGSGLGRTDVEMSSHVGSDLDDLHLLVKGIDSLGAQTEQPGNTIRGLAAVMRLPRSTAPGRHTRADPQPVLTTRNARSSLAHDLNHTDQEVAEARHGA